MSDITELNNIIQSGEEVPSEKVEEFREAVATSSENSITQEVGSEAKEDIMNWWYSTIK